MSTRTDNRPVIRCDSCDRPFRHPRVDINLVLTSCMRCSGFESRRELIEATHALRDRLHEGDITVVGYGGAPGTADANGADGSVTITWFE